MAALAIGLIGAKAVEAIGRNPEASGKILTGNAFRNGICRSYRNLFINFSFHKIIIWKY
jgi:F0F1-type ATP synthase membrane subunit c/vacuolar-type H+-ATPase subunit K